MKPLDGPERRRRARYLRGEAARTKSATLARLLEQRAERLTARKRSRAGA